MIPLRAENKRQSPAIITTLLIIVNFVVFFYQISLSPRRADALVANLGVVPARAERILAPPNGHPARPVPIEAVLFPLVASMFLHGGWLHILGNMLFLWVFGGSVEDRLGHSSYLIFYLICGVGSGIIHILANWGSTIPSIGASGAISGVMGAYIILFPRSKILTLVPLLFFFFTVRLPAVLMLGYWFIIQFLSGVTTLGQINEGGVAWWAHIGGFVLGILLVLIMREGSAGPRRAWS